MLGFVKNWLRPPLLLVVTTDKAVAGEAFLKRLWEIQGPVKATPKDIGRNGWENCREGLVIHF